MATCATRFWRVDFADLIRKRWESLEEQLHNEHFAESIGKVWPGMIPIRESSTGGWTISDSDGDVEEEKGSKPIESESEDYDFPEFADDLADGDEDAHEPSEPKRTTPAAVTAKTPPAKTLLIHFPPARKKRDRTRF